MISIFNPPSIFFSSLSLGLALILVCSILLAGTSHAESASIEFTAAAPPLQVTPKLATVVTRSYAAAMHGSVKYAKDFTHFDYANPKAPKGGLVRRSSVGTFDSLNPFIAKGNAESNVGMIYDSLMTQSADEAFSIYALIAQAIEYPKDRSWVIFHINPNARFHDDKKIQASDVAFSFNILMDKGAPTFKQMFIDVDRVEVLDSHRVKFYFHNNTNRDLMFIIASIPIMPEHYWQDKNFDKSSLDIPTGSGPYRINALSPGKHISYSRIKNYWAKDLAVNKGRFNFDQIRFDYYRDSNIDLEAFKAGEYDFRTEHSSKAWATEYAGAQFTSGTIIREEVRDYSPQGIQAFILNTRRRPFNDQAMRRAMILAFDFEWSNNNLFYGAYKRSPSYFTNSELAATGLPSGRELEILETFQEQLPSSIFTHVYQLPHTDGSGRDRKNLIAAQALLKQAGYKIFKGKLHAPHPSGNTNNRNSKAISIEFITYSPLFERIINPYIKNLKKLGITAELRIIDTSQYINRLRNFDFDVTTIRRSQAQSPGNEQRNMWTTQAANTTGSGNHSGIKNPVIDALVEMIVTAPDRTELVARTRALDRVLLHYDYVVPQWFQSSHRIAYRNIFSRPQTTAAFDINFDINFSTWWMQ